MKLIYFFLRVFRGTIVLAVLTALISGGSVAGLVALIHTVLSDSEPASGMLVWRFAGLTLVTIIGALTSHFLVLRLSQRTMADLRMDLSRKILATPLRHLEEVGTARLLVAFTDDVYVITEALTRVPGFVTSIAVLFGGVVYLGWLSWTALLAMVGFTVLGASTYRLLAVKAFKARKVAREEQDMLFKHFRALTDGIKELKLHRNRRRTFLSQNLQPTTESYRRYNIIARTFFIVAANWARLLFIVLLGLIIFVLPTLTGINTRTLMGYALFILYFLGPLELILFQHLPAFVEANIAQQKVEALGLELAIRPSQEPFADQPEKSPSWKHLELVGVTHSYHHDDENSSFTVGPVDLIFHPEEVVFLVGGNGSGKTTLAKIVTGLYLPDTGEIRLDGKPITDSNRDDYRQLFSAVFADFYLFESLLGLSDPNLDAMTLEYLVKLKLNHKVEVKDGVLSTTALSQGQRKRLALLTAYLEDRPFYVFDEWAHDQNPAFKKIFYTQFLPELKARGKAVLVISHDDRYFYMADRCLKMEDGKLQQGE